MSLQKSTLFSLSLVQIFKKGELYYNKRNKTSQVVITCLFCCWIILAVWMTVSSKCAVPGQSNRFGVKHLRYTLILKRISTSISFQFELVKNLTKNKYENEFPNFLSFNSPVTQKCWVYPSSLERYLNELDTSNSRNPELMKYEWARYATFKTFPMESPVMPIRLASNGFYFNGSRDVVTCFSCGLVHGGWKDGDSVSDIHALLSPSCQYLRGTDETNVGIHGYDVHGATGGGTCETDSGCRSGEVLVQRQSGNFSDNDASSSRRRNKFPKYESYQRRIDTYSKWPCTETIEPRILAEAGYFYAGLSDCVRCFSCGGGLRNWEYGDGPWEEHARWFHWCSFLHEQKGPEFIQRHRDVQTDSDDEILPGSTSIVSGKEALNALKENQTHTDRMPNAQNDKNDPTDISSEMKQMVESLREMGFEESDIQDSLKRTGTTEIKETSFSNLLDDLLTHSAPSDQNRTSQSTNDTSMTKTTHENTDNNRQTSNKTAPIINADSYKEMDPKILEEKNSRLKDQLNCKICMDEDSSVVFIPCGHMVSCETCAPNIRKCAICRQPIKGRVKAFMS